MYSILEAKELVADLIYEFVVKAPNVAANCEPGQFVIVRTDEESERIPLTICDYDRKKETITIVVQLIGASTYKMKYLKTGDAFCDFVGPLGRPSELIDTPIDELKQKKILFVAGGLGTAPVYPQVKWLHEHGVAADVIIGAKTKDLLIMEDEMEAVAGTLYDLCITIGPMIMMKFVCLLTKKLELKTIVSMNPIMVDGTGMCGACRLTVGDSVKFACVDGPEFDGHLVNFDEAMKRTQIYKTAEGRAYLKAKEGDTHHGGCGNCGGDK